MTMFDSRILLVTGGTGSFGNAVVKRFLDTQIGETILAVMRKTGGHAKTISE